MKKVLYVATIILLLIVFVISAWKVGSYFLDSKEQENRYDDLAAIKEAAKNEATTTPAETQEQPGSTEETEPAEKPILADYAGLYEMNNDLVGWLKIEGTKLNYPVMQTSEDNKDFYLDHNFDKEHSVRGCIFAREERDVNAPSDNITLYGHNMMDGSMFAALNAYTDKAAWDNNSLIFFDTLTEYHTYKIFAVFKTSASLGKGFSYHQFVDAADEEAFNEFVATCKDLAFYDTGVTPVYGDKIICLSTCEYTLNNGRLVVAAVRIS